MALGGGDKKGGTLQRKKKTFILKEKRSKLALEMGYNDGSGVGKGPLSRSKRTVHQHKVSP